MNKNNPQKKTTKIIVLIAIIGAIAIVVAGIILIALGGFPNDFLSAGASEDTEASANSSGKDNENDTYYADEYDENYQLRHAPNMYVDWVSSSNYEGAYDAFIIDWKCTETAEGTYWAVHEWDEGYAGFQDRENACNVVLMSLWNLPDGTQPQVEYYSDPYDYGDFDHEGNGAYVFTPYEWEVGVWYSMKIEITYEENKTIFTQYVCKEGEDWLKAAALSYPTIVEITRPTHVFQEDYCFNDLSRSCILRNAAGRFTETEEWDHWNEFIVDSSYYPDENDENSLWSVSFGCDYRIYDDSVEIFSGGRGNIPSGKEMPYEGRFD